MAKVSNELDLSAVQRKLKSNYKTWSEIFSRFSKEQHKAIDSLVKNKSVVCCIFAGSVAFRIGKSSIKSVSGYGSGFKGSFNGSDNAKATFIDKQYSASGFQLSKNNFVIAAAFYFLYNEFSRVKTESDKTEAAEGEQVLATQAAMKEILGKDGSVHIKIGKHIYQVDKFEQIGGRPKADALFSFKGTPVVWVSL